MSDHSSEPSPATAAITPVTPEVGPSLGSLTFPAYRHLLTLAPNTRHLDGTIQRTIHPAAIAAWVGPEPVGLILAELPSERGTGVDPELLSLFVLPDWRGQDIAEQLVAA